jgi:hypothetical protein
MTVPKFRNCDFFQELDPGSGVDVMITIFGNFRQFSVKKIGAFPQKPIL